MLLLLFTFLFYWALPALVLVTISRLALKRSRGTAQPQLAFEAELVVPRTPAAAELRALQLKEQRRPSDIVCNEHSISLKNLALSGAASSGRPLTSLRLPLNECSMAAADAIEEAVSSLSVPRTFPASFDLVCSGGGLVAFYGGAVSSVLGDLSRRGIITVGKLHGVSSGALVCATYLGVESGFTKLEDIYRCYQIFARSRWLSFAMRQFLHECLPPDIHERASKRMHITVTEISAATCWLPTRRVICNFATRDELLDTIMASTVIPGLTAPGLHRPTSRPGSYWLDGSIVKLPPRTASTPRALKLAQMATIVRLGYWPFWIFRPLDADFDAWLAMPALKDVVRLLAQGEQLPLRVMAFI